MRPVDMNWQNEITLVDINDERVTVRVTKKHNNTVLTQDIIAYANITRVDVVSHVDWQEKYKIRTHLPKNGSTNLLLTVSQICQMMFTVLQLSTTANTVTMLLTTI